MMPNETRRRLLGERLKGIEEIGAKAWIVYEVLRSVQPYRDLDWEYRPGVDVPDGDAVVAEVQFERFVGMSGPDEVESLVRALCAKNPEGSWVYDYEVTDDSVVAVVGVYQEPTIRFAAELLVQVRRSRVERDLGPPIRPKVGSSTRVQTAKEMREKAKAETDEKRERNRKRRERRSIKKTSSKAGTRGSRARGKSWVDPEGIEGVKEDKEGLWRLYEDLFVEHFGYDPGVFKKGVPTTKGANQLAAVANEYGVDTAIKAVAYAVRNWEEYQKIKGDARTPMPSVLWGIRHELCPPIKQGLDPWAELRRLRKRKTGKDKLKDREWKEGDEGEIGEW